jgi:hypothetical protein
MANLDPILDSYIENIIKKNQVGTPDPTKTSGEQMRELIKKVRDHFETLIADKVAKLEGKDTALEGIVNTYSQKLPEKSQLTGGNAFTGNQSIQGELSVTGTLRGLGAEAILGTSTVPAVLTVNNTSHKIKVLPNIGNGLASLEFNSNQSNAYRLSDSAGVNYLVLNSVSGAPSIKVVQPWVLDNGVSVTLNHTQAAVTSAGAGVKVLAVRNGSTLTFPMTVNGSVMTVSGKLLVKTATASAVIHAAFTCTLKRVSNVISILNNQVTVYSDNGTSGFSIGASATAANDGVQLFFTPGTSDAMAYSGAFFDIAYTS